MLWERAGAAVCAKTLIWPVHGVRTHEGLPGLHGLCRHWLKCGVSVPHIPQKGNEKSLLHQRESNFFPVPASKIEGVLRLTFHSAL